MTHDPRDILRNRIRLQAYELWEKEGRPAGRETIHWLQAEEQVISCLDCALKWESKRKYSAADIIKFAAVLRSNRAIPEAQLAGINLLVRLLERLE